jgi:hypothetical protein
MAGVLQQEVLTNTRTLVSALAMLNILGGIADDEASISTTSLKLVE